MGTLDEAVAANVLVKAGRALAFRDPVLRRALRDGIPGPLTRSRGRWHDRLVSTTFVYDGDCAFCTSCAQFIERRIPSTAALVPWQFADLDRLGLTREQAESAVQWVGADGTVAAGPDAVAELLRDAGRWWELPGRALRFGPVRAVAWPAYRFIAGHRHLLPGGTAACSLPQAERDRRYGPRTDKA